MKFRLLFVFMMLVPSMAQAADDPILFTVGDMPVTRSEFEKSYLRNAVSSRVSRMTVADYLELYIIYKLKVKAALDAHIDGTSSFKGEYAQCLVGQSESTTSLSGDIPVTRHGTNDWRLRSLNHGEAICLAQIMIRVPQKASRDEQRKAQQRIESVYQDLQNGADFAQLARQYSQDEESSVTDGVMGWFGRGQMLKEIEDVAFVLRKGEVSRPFLSTIGYHILMMKDRKPLQGTKEQFAHQQVSTSRLSGDVLEQVQTETAGEVKMPTDALQREYFEGLLLYEQSKQSVGRQAAENEEALKYYFKKNKKKYRRRGFKPKDYTEVRELVMADLQEEMNKHWIADLRKQYPVNVNKKVLKTVNNHH
ncbi:MAG: peptidyl-prolyl cis-trans isomerase [Paludibacteraceae bacterium]|nr:peptidyl-prolyl cis-trans isomerase [Paludibacteraceae bacterium]MBQ8714969.1 peptidyl-prolyl cis-trans isomerase [Prevotella sp.]